MLKIGSAVYANPPRHAGATDGRTYDDVRGRHGIVIKRNAEYPEWVLVAFRGQFGGLERYLHQDWLQ